LPTYEYACRSCGEHLDAVQSFTEDALTECPKCGGELRKVFGNVGIVFKGSGFYKNDSRSTTSSVTPASTNTSSESATPATSDSPAASTPAATPAPAAAAPSISPS